MSKKQDMGGLKPLSTAPATTPRHPQTPPKAPNRNPKAPSNNPCHHLQQPPIAPQDPPSCTLTRQRVREDVHVSQQLVQHPARPVHHAVGVLGGHLHGVGHPTDALHHACTRTRRPSRGAHKVTSRTHTHTPPPHVRTEGQGGGPHLAHTRRASGEGGAGAAHPHA